MNSKYITLTILTGIIFMICSCAGKKEYTAYIDGNIHTMDKANPIVECIVVKDGRFVYAGSKDGLKDYRNCETIGLQGKTVLPGLIDAHCHMNSLGKMLDELKLKGITSKEETVRLVKQRADTAETGRWITGRGWDQNLWAGEQFPSKEDLREISSNPVFLVRVDGHAAWVNQPALDICGLDKNTPDPDGGRILRASNGEPTGILLDNAIELVRSKIPQPSPEIVRTRMLNAMKECNKYGLTAVGDAYVTQNLIELYKNLADSGLSTVRIYGMLADSVELTAKWFEQGPLLGYADGMFTVRAIKLFADGALGSRGALFFKPFNDDPGNCGIEVTSEEDIYNNTLSALNGGFQVCVHAIGDKANNNVLNAYERSLKEKPTPDHRLRLEHAQILALADIPRLHLLGIIASMQPTHATSDMPWAEERMGSDRIKGAYAWRSILESGAKIAFGSDFPIEDVNPFLGIYAAVTRQDLQGNPPGGWYPQQCLTVEESVEAFTVGAAYAQFMEDEIGMIKSGMRADFIVIDRDIFTVPSKEIAGIQVLQTVLNGKTVFSK